MRPIRHTAGLPGRLTIGLRGRLTIGVPGRLTIGVLLPLLAALPWPVAAQSYRGPGMARTEVAPGVHAFTFDNPLGDAGGVDGNAVAIINTHDVIVVDAQGTPATARRVIDEIRKLTPLPVHYVVNTHWHGDHWLGNQAYREAFPQVEFIAHPHARIDMEGEEIPGFTRWRDGGVDSYITQVEERLAAGKRRDGTPYTAADSATIQRQLAALRWFKPQLAEVTPVLPTLTVADSLVLHRGERTIVVRFAGRGNTRGDLTVWLPREQVLVTGDLLVGPAPYSFGSYLTEWIATLGALRALPARVIVPGHGPLRRDWAYLDLVRELLTATRDQARAAVARGLDLSATRAAVDLHALRERFVGNDAAVGRAFDAFFVQPAVERAWLEARGEVR